MTLKIQRLRAALLLATAALFLFISGCGGGGSSTPAPTSVTTPTPTPTPTGGTTAPAGVISVGAGQTVSGVDINVASPVSSPPPNAELLGVTNVGSGGSASNSGATIHRGSTMRVLVFGHGLTGSMTVSISGPSDITASNIQGITSTDNTPGLSFTAAVASGAAVGARTVSLKNSNGDITTFTGGLEVIP